jgi:repressor LexA
MNHGKWRGLVFCTLFQGHGYIIVLISERVNNYFQLSENNFMGGVFNVIDRIFHLLDERGISPYKLSKELGISSSKITEWKKGSYKPSLDAILMLAKYFDVSADYILGLSPIKEISIEISAKKEPLPLDKVLARDAIGACLSSPSFYDEQISVEAPRHQIKWPKAVHMIERMAKGQLSYDRLNSFLKIATSHTSFEDVEYPTLDEYSLLRKLANKIEQHISMGGISRDELADEFLEHLKAKESDSVKAAALVDELSAALSNTTDNGDYS